MMPVQIFANIENSPTDTVLGCHSLTACRSQGGAHTLRVTAERHAPDVRPRAEGLAPDASPGPCPLCPAWPEMPMCLAAGTKLAASGRWGRAGDDAGQHSRTAARLCVPVTWESDGVRGECLGPTAARGLGNTCCAWLQRSLGKRSQWGARAQGAKPQKCREELTAEGVPLRVGARCQVPQAKPIDAVSALLHYKINITESKKKKKKGRPEISPLRQMS